MQLRDVFIIYWNSRQQIMDGTCDVEEGRIESITNSVLMAERLACDRAPQTCSVNGSETPDKVTHILSSTSSALSLPSIFALESNLLKWPGRCVLKSSGMCSLSFRSLPNWSCG